MEPIASRPTEQPALTSFEPPGMKSAESHQESLRASIEAAIRRNLKEDVVMDVSGSVKIVTDSGAIQVNFDSSRDAHSPLNSSGSPAKFEAAFSPDGTASSASRDLPLSGNKNRRKNSKPTRRIDLASDTSFAEDLTKKVATCDLEEAPLDLCVSSRRAEPHSPAFAAAAAPTAQLPAVPFQFNPLLQMLATPDVTEAFANFQATPAVLSSQFMMNSLMRSGPPPLTGLVAKEPEPKMEPKAPPAMPPRIKRIRNAASLGGHRAKRSGSSKCFRCNQCGCTFPALALLSKHTFSAHRAFRCMVCGSNFTQRSNLQRHSLKHVGFKPFICNICNRAYYRKDHLVRHIEVTHPGNEPRANITSKLSSSECLDYLDNMIRAGHISELRLNASSPDNSSGNEDPAEGMDCIDENTCSEVSGDVENDSENIEIPNHTDAFVFDKKDEKNEEESRLTVGPSEIKELPVCVK